MDGMNWRHSLVSWINQTNFVEKPIDDITYSDVNGFFVKFKEKMAKQVEITQDLIDFIKNYYPDFEPTLDETGQIIISDYMFIYSLFLHFSCVMFPEPFFHSKCFALKPKCQSSIQAFLKILTESEKFDKNSLRNAIRESTPANPRLSFLNLSFNTPQRTPKNFKNSPPTPTSQLLDEKGREVKLLKAQLDSEKYERGFLEVQVKQYEERLSKLVKDQKNYQQEIKDLKNEILSQETENFSPNRNMKEESVKQRLRDKIAERDEQIIQLKFDIDSINEDYKHLSDKWVYSDKEMRKQMSRVQELEGVVIDLEAEVQQKIEIIENLQSQVEDLENHISQTRANMPKEVLDSSGDLLDLSFNKESGINIFTEETESENMGIIIDMKLKESEHENDKLRNELNRLNVEVTSQIKEVLFKLDPNHVISDAVTLDEHIEVMTKAYTQLNDERFELESKFKEAQSKLELIEKDIASVRDERDLLSCEIKETKEKVNELIQHKTEFLEKIDEMKDRIRELDDGLTKSNDICLEVKEKNEILNKELIDSRQKNERLEQQLKESVSEIENLGKKITEDLEREADLKHMHQILQDDYDKISDSCEKYKSKCAVYSSESQSLNEKLKKMDKTLKNLNEIQESLRTEVEGLKQDLSLKEDRCKSLETDLTSAQKREEATTIEIKRLKNELNENQNKIIELTSKLEMAIQEAKEAALVRASEIVEHNKETEKLRLELDQVAVKLSESLEKCEKLEKELGTMVHEQSEVISDLNNQISELQNEKASFQNLLEETKTSQTSLSKNLERLNSELEEERSATINSQLLLNKTIESLKAEIVAKSAQIDRIRLNSELAGDEMTQKINELEVAAMRAVEEKRVFEERTNGEFNMLRQVILNDKESITQVLNQGQEGVNTALVGLQSRIKRLQSMIEGLATKNSELKANLKDAHLKIEVQSSQIQQMSAQNTDIEAKITSLERTLSDSKESHAKLVEENKDLKCQNESLSNVATRYSEAIDTGNRTIEELTNDLNNTSLELERVRSDKVLLENEIRGHLANISQLETDLNALETEIRQVNEKLQEKNAFATSLKNDLDINKAEKSALTDSVKQLEAECITLSDKLDELKQGHEKVLSEKASLEQEKSVLIQSLDKLSSEHQTVMEENDAINASNKKIIEKLELIVVQKQQTSQNMRALKDSVQLLKQKNLKLKEEVEISVQEGRTVIEKVKAEFDVVQIDLERHKNVKQELTEKNLDLQGQIKALNSEIEGFQVNQKELEQRIKDKETEVTQKIDSLQTDLLKKEQEIENLQSKISQQLTSMAEQNEELHELKMKAQELDKLQERNETILSETISLKDTISTKESEIQNLRKEMATLSQEKSLLERDLARVEQDRKSLESESTRIKQDFHEHQTTLTTEINSLNQEKSQLAEENHKIQANLVQLEQKLRECESLFENFRIQSQLDLSEVKINNDNLQSELSKAKTELEDIQNTINSVTQQNTELKTTNEKLRLDNETLIKSNEELQVKYTAVCEASSSKSDIERLEKQFKESDMEKAKQNEKIIEMFKKSEQLKDELAIYKTKETKMLQDINILTAKLHKHRDHSNAKEKELMEKISELQEKLECRNNEADQHLLLVRGEMEGKLQKMKDKMTTIYNDDMTRIKNKHEHELLDLRHQHSEFLEKHEKLRATADKLSKQLHMKNEENLDLLKQNKFMENKIRLMETSDSGSLRSLNQKKSTNMPPPFGNLKMEDEPGEVFDNTYLTDLKNGRMADDFASRNSLALSEIQRRNSQWPAHMRSAYPSQFMEGDAGEDEIRDGIPSANDSHLSLLSNGQGKGKKIGGKTAYHRPGPPTPSKNAGRLSFGPEEGRLSGVMPKKTVPSPKFKFFHSSKVKDESPEKDLASIIRPQIESNPVQQMPLVTKRRQKDFNGNHPDFYELLRTDDYTKYRDNSRNSSESTSEEDETDVIKEEQLESAIVSYEGPADESFDVAELNKTESPACCPILVRRRSLDKKTNDKIVRDKYKRRSQDKRIATFNNLRSKTTNNNNNNNNTPSTSADKLLPISKNNCNNLNASDNSLEDVSCDFESLMHNKISEIAFRGDHINAHDDSSTDDKSNGSGFLSITLNKYDKNSKKIDASPFCISSRLPQLSRPSEMFQKNSTFKLTEQKTKPNRLNSTVYSPQMYLLFLGLAIILLTLYILLMMLR